MELAQILGWTATFLFTVCYIPQIIKTLTTRTVDGLSFWLLFLQLVANVVALTYATLITQAPLQVKYVLAMAFLMVTIGVYLHVLMYQRRKRSADAKNNVPDVTPEPPVGL
ncbi:MAG: PQ-loop repeat-containing protein [Patescibacteria group bacterium]